MTHQNNSNNLVNNHNSPIKKSKTETAILACGCFWGTQYWFRKLDGLTDVISGYSGGHLENPKYEHIKTGQTGHLESVKVVFDPTVINYEQVIKYYYEIHDFTQTDGQGYDLGQQYKSAIFYSDETQNKIALDVKKKLENKGFRVATMILPFKNFYLAEEYHQNYFSKNLGLPDCHFYKRIWN